MAEIIKEEDLVQVNGGTYKGACWKYTIQPGDTLSEIAVRYGTTVAILCDINDIKNPNKIYAYATLYIPYKQ